MKLKIEPWPTDSKSSDPENFGLENADLRETSTTFPNALEFVVDIAGAAIRLPDWEKGIALIMERVSRSRETLVWIGTHEPEIVSLTADQMLSGDWELWLLREEFFLTNQEAKVASACPIVSKPNKEVAE